MKNFKKIIILGVIALIIIVYFIYNKITQRNYENIVEENYIEIVENKTEENQEMIVLHITGEVNLPGLVEIKNGSRLLDAIEAAGGLTQNADINKVNLAYIVSDGQKIYIPSYEDQNVESYITEDIGENIIDDEINLNKNNLVNINTATQTELETLTGIGPSTALKIINYRKENGKFKSIEEIKNVSGIGEQKYEAIKNNICV